VASEFLKRPLLKGWISLEDGQGTLYKHVKTGFVSYVHPLDE
jgi:hypothetical protein